MKKEGRLPYDPMCEMHFSKDEFTEKTENRVTISSYSCLERITAAKNAFYLFHNVSQAYIIPYSIFSNEHEKTEFYDFMCEKARHRVSA